MSNLEVFPVPAFNDNYIWAIVNGSSFAVVDPGDADPVFAFIQERGLGLVSILITHHHFDHTGGVAELKRLTSAKVFYPLGSPFAEGDEAVGEGDSIEMEQLGTEFKVITTPGHTLDHVCYYREGMLFCGDTLFSGGCGRLFEGTPDQMRHSLQKLCRLPQDTKVYCAHEYTLSNLKFAFACDLQNARLEQYQRWCQQQRQEGRPTLPSSIGLEQEINPFLRCDTVDIQSAVMRECAQSAPMGQGEIFAALRAWKDRF